MKPSTVNNISFVLPEGFHDAPVSDTLPYIDKKDDVAVYQHTKKEAQIIFNKTSIKVKEKELPDFKDFYEELFTSINASIENCIFFNLGKKEAIRIDFINKAVIHPNNENEKIIAIDFYNNFVTFEMSGKLNLINCSYPLNNKDAWSGKMETFINSVSIKSSWF